MYYSWEREACLEDTKAEISPVRLDTQSEVCKDYGFGLMTFKNHVKAFPSITT